MNREVNTPNIVVDDNYRMLVKRLTRRYAERGASAFTDADVLEQERSDARARAIAPDAYRISRTLGDNPEMYKSGDASGSRFMTTDDYLVYFSRCHDTFDAVNYYNLHSDASVGVEEEKPRVLVNRKRMEMIKNGTAEKKYSRVRKPAEVVEEEKESILSRFGFSKRRTFAAMVGAAASVVLVIGSVFAVIPDDEVNTYARNLPEEEVVNLAQVEGQDILQNRE